MQKNNNTSADIIQVQWQNHSCTGSIYIYNYQEKNSQGAYCVKFTNVLHINQIQLPLPVVQTPYYLQLIPHIINYYLIKELVYFLVPIMGQSVTGSPIKAISFDSVNVAWSQKLFFSLPLYYYSFKRVQISFALYLSSIKGGYLRPLFKFFLFQIPCCRENYF